MLKSDSWTIDLAKHWHGVALPRIACETRELNNLGLQGQCAVLGSTDSTADWFDLDHPVLLLTHREAKPWGAELWYTGIEKRGVCSVEFAGGKQLPLPFYLALLAGSSASPQTPPLLKVLDPLDDPRRGSLYIEIHREKWETYIVSAVSERLYPAGEGELLFGFSDEKQALFGSDEAAFRSALIEDVRRYETVRRVVDGERPHSALAEAGFTGWSNLEELERALWKTVQSYFRLRKVRVGDVIQVPPFIPHSLQPGVRVVEFQTPTYERLILAFNQKVQTQPHWDTAEAVALAQLDTPTGVEATGLDEWQRIVDFPEFSVNRASIAGGQEVSWSEPCLRQGLLLFVISGRVEICARQSENNLAVSSEQAAFIPARVAHETLKFKNVGQQPAVVLLV